MTVPESTRPDVDRAVHRIRAAPPRLGRTRLVLVDGPSGAGKTTFAHELAAALAATPGATVTTVHTDDLLDGWDDQFTYWPRLWRTVLDPIRCGRPGAYQRYDWVAGRFAGPVTTVAPGGVLLVEGVGCAHAGARDWATLSVFVTAPTSVCQARTSRRDGPAMEPYLAVWREREAVHFAADGTADAVDLLVDGQSLPS